MYAFQPKLSVPAVLVDTIDFLHFIPFDFGPHEKHSCLGNVLLLKVQSWFITNICFLLRYLCVFVCVCACACAQVYIYMFVNTHLFVHACLGVRLCHIKLKSVVQHFPILPHNHML